MLRFKRQSKKTYILRFVLIASLSMFFQACGGDDEVPQENKRLSGTKWLITRYDTPYNTSVEPNDTLQFVGNDHYSINGGSAKAYELNEHIGQDRYSLILYHCPTFGGTYRGLVLSSFIDDGMISNTEFFEFRRRDSLRVWMVELR